MLILLIQDIRISNAFNAIFVDTVDRNDIHNFAHNFLNILPIFNLIKFWKAEAEGFATISSNTTYLDTVNRRHKYF